MKVKSGLAIQSMSPAHEGYFNGCDSIRLYDIRSAGKSFTFTLIGTAIDHGAIPDVDV